MISAIKSLNRIIDEKIKEIREFYNLRDAMIYAHPSTRRMLGIQIEVK